MRVFHFFILLSLCIDAVTDDERPPTPLNLSVVPHRNSLQITWSIASGQTVRPADYHIVQYRTVGHWVPLSNRIPAGQLSYNWTTASRGAVYHFRVIGHYDPLTIGLNGEHQGALVDDTGSGTDDESLESLPSVTFTVNTGGKSVPFCGIFQLILCVQTNIDHVTSALFNSASHFSFRQFSK